MRPTSHAREERRPEGIAALAEARSRAKAAAKSAAGSDKVKVVAEHFGFTAEHVAAAAKRVLEVTARKPPSQPPRAKGE
jgi:hypothetical protein